MGYYSSWPLFTLTHHLLAMYCAEQVHPGQKFDKYAILGDDVVICGIEVAKIYKQTNAELGVDISMSKSLISHSGSAEFAKRFWCKGLTVPTAPVSIRNLLNSHHLPGALSLLHSYKIKRFSTFCRLHGAGFRVISRVSSQIDKFILRSIFFPEI